MSNLTIKSFIRDCQEAYYNGDPIISDEEYDRIIQRFPELESDIGIAGDIPHTFRLYSLEKFYPCRGDSLPDIGEVVETPKLDGGAVEFLYVYGKLVSALTRGDGIKGKDKTDNLKLLVPNNLNGILEGSLPRIMQIRGEVVVYKPEGLENVRNFANGKVNLSDPSEFAKYSDVLMFVAYGVTINDIQDGWTDSYTHDMSNLSKLGFNTCTSELVKELTDNGSILTDGRVFRVDSNERYSDLGFTHKFPKGSYAVKEDDDGEITTLTEVCWQVGKTGKVTPVAYFEPVIIDDATINKATLSNPGIIEAMELEIGCLIRVIRAGGVIPKIVERVYEDNL